MTKRFSWRQAQELIEKHTGPVFSARPVQEGYNSEISVVVNDSVFVKGMRAGHPRVWTQERERQVNPYVQDFSARLSWSETSDEWDLNGFEFLDGRQASYRPDSSDLGLIVAMMRQWPPAPGDIELKQAPDRWAAYSDRPELFAGRWLAHTDWSPGNVLIVNATARMLDWAWPTAGARWLDPACWTVWLIADGHTPAQAEAWANRLPWFATAPETPITAFAHAQAAMWKDIKEHAPHPGLAAAAARWARHRTGRPRASPGAGGV